MGHSHTHLRNFLAVAALILSLAALQSPLWRPDAIMERITAMAGSTALVSYDHPMEKATVFKPKVATLTAARPGQILIHAIAPGKTSILVRYKNGQTTLYEVDILPPSR